MDRAPRHERTALVVDDDVFVLSALAEMLEEEGYDVTTASNGFSGMRLAAERRPAVILLDLMLPELSGMDMLTELRAAVATSDVAIVVVTGKPDQLTAAQLSETDGLVAKPFDMDELLATVRRAIQRADSRRAEVAPVSAITHREFPVRPRRAASARRTRGRR